MEIVYIIAAVVIALVGNGVVSQWLLQRDRSAHDRDIQRLRTELEADIRKLQNELDRTIVVHRVHFETEFAALRDIWARVAAVRSSMASVRPMMSIVPRDETPEARDAREFVDFRTFTEDLDSLVRAVDSQSPFISIEVFRALEAVIATARGEAIEVRVERGDRDRNPMRDWYGRGREHYLQLQTDAMVVSDLIRARLEKLRVADGTGR